MREALEVRFEPSAYQPLLPSMCTFCLDFGTWAIRNAFLYHSFRLLLESISVQTLVEALRVEHSVKLIICGVLTTCALKVGALGEACFLCFLCLFAFLHFCSLFPMEQEFVASQGG